MDNPFFTDDSFHSCALRAFVDITSETATFPPDSDLTKKRAYEYYESERKCERK